MRMMRIERDGVKDISSQKFRLKIEKGRWIIHDPFTGRDYCLDDRYQVMDLCIAMNNMAENIQGLWDDNKGLREKLDNDGDYQKLREEIRGLKDENENLKYRLDNIKNTVIRGY